MAKREVSVAKQKGDSLEPSKPTGQKDQNDDQLPQNGDQISDGPVLPEILKRKASKLSSRIKSRNLPAKAKHIIFSRDQGRCTFIHPEGRRCEQARWVEIHHLHPRHLGGSDEPENLTTLCSNHHKARHELQADGQTDFRGQGPTY